MSEYIITKVPLAVWQEQKELEVMAKKILAVEKIGKWWLKIMYHPDSQYVKNTLKRHFNKMRYVQNKERKQQNFDIKVNLRYTNCFVEKMNIITKVPLAADINYFPPKRFHRMPILYLEMLENKARVKKELINKSYNPPSFINGEDAK